MHVIHAMRNSGNATGARSRQDLGAGVLSGAAVAAHKRPFLSFGVAACGEPRGSVSPGTSGHIRAWKRAPMLGNRSQPGKLTGTAAPAAPTRDQGMLP